jgi:glycosyltransferase involved in cell wall biosynthesis
MSLNTRFILPPWGHLAEDRDQGISGMPKATLELAKALADVADWNSELVTYRKEGEVSREAVSENLTITRINQRDFLKLGGIDLSYQAPVYVKQIFKQTPDVLHSVASPFYLRAPKADSRVLHLHNPLEELSWDKRRCLEKAQHIITPSEYLKHAVVDQTPHDEPEITAVHNGVDLERYGSGTGSRFRQKFDIPEDHTLILYVGQIIEGKGLLHLVKAFNDLANDYNDISLAVIGSTDLWDLSEDNVADASAYEQTVLETADTDRIKFCGRTSDSVLIDGYDAADIFVCPSVWNEPFPLVNLEAMAAGNPVIGTDMGGIPELIENEETGFVVTPGEPEAINEKLELLVQTESMRKEMGEAAQNHVQKNYTWKQAASKTLEIYQQLE